MSAPETTATLPMNESDIQRLAKEKGVTPEELVSLARKAFGAIGGKSGTGPKKRRSPEHYAKMVEARNRQRKQAKENPPPTREEKKRTLEYLRKQGA